MKNFILFVCLFCSLSFFGQTSISAFPLPESLVLDELKEELASREELDISMRARLHQETFSSEWVQVSCDESHIDAAPSRRVFDSTPLSSIDWAWVLLKSSGNLNSSLDSVWLRRPYSYFKRNRILNKGNCFTLDVQEVDVVEEVCVSKFYYSDVDEGLFSPPDVAGKCYQPITGVFYRSGVVADSFFLSSGDTIIATSNHPVWSASQNKYLAIGDLQKGELLGVVNTSDAFVSLLERREGSVSNVVNLEVKGSAHYLVGGVGLIAHNSYIHLVAKALDIRPALLRYIAKANGPAARIAARNALGDLQKFILDLPEGVWENFVKHTATAAGQVDVRLIRAYDKVRGMGIPNYSSHVDFMPTLTKMTRYQDEASTAASGNVKYYRVQTNHPDSKFLSLDESSGTLVFNNPNKTLYMSSTTTEHAKNYALGKVKKGHTVEIIEFEVPKSFDNQMKAAAIPQHKATTANALNPNGTLPQIVDPHLKGDPFGLPSTWQQNLELVYIPGSAKRVDL